MTSSPSSASAITGLESSNRAERHDGPRCATSSRAIRESSRFDLAWKKTIDNAATRA